LRAVAARMSNASATCPMVGGTFVAGRLTAVAPALLGVGPVPSPSAFGPGRPQRSLTLSRSAQARSADLPTTEPRSAASTSAPCWDRSRRSEADRMRAGRRMPQERPESRYRTRNARSSQGNARMAYATASSSMPVLLKPGKLHCAGTDTRPIARGALGQAISSRVTQRRSLPRRPQANLAVAHRQAHDAFATGRVGALDAPAYSPESNAPSLLGTTTEAS
jgi:hypothetical protein